MLERPEAILRQANAAIADGDIEGFLRHCTDDIRWTTVGESTLEGKDAVRRWMAVAYAPPPDFTVTRLIADADHVVALGELKDSDDKGAPTTRTYCDVWRFRDGKMAELQAFVI